AGRSPTPGKIAVCRPLRPHSERAPGAAPKQGLPAARPLPAAPEWPFDRYPWLDLPSLQTIGQILGRANGQSHDPRGDAVRAGKRHKTASVGDEEILHIMRLAIAVQYALCGIGSHAGGAALVSGVAHRLHIFLV